MGPAADFELSRGYKVGIAALINERFKSIPRDLHPLKVFSESVMAERLE